MKQDKPEYQDPHNCWASCSQPGESCEACTNPDYFVCKKSGICIHPQLRQNCWVPVMFSLANFELKVWWSSTVRARRGWGSGRVLRDLPPRQGCASLRHLQMQELHLPHHGDVCHSLRWGGRVSGWGGWVFLQTWLLNTVLCLHISWSVLNFSWTKCHSHMLLQKLESPRSAST